ncbi:MAG: DUF4164 family protein [Alphaproteobacteria bacterium]|nr:DUF4164 family protein [Alphaproteobacteria bacterium]
MAGFGSTQASTQQLASALARIETALGRIEARARPARIESALTAERDRLAERVKSLEAERRELQQRLKTGEGERQRIETQAEEVARRLDAAVADLKTLLEDAA